MTEPMSEEQRQQAIIEAVDTHGCSVAYVTDTGVPDRDFSFSIGFESSVGQPEVLVYGLPKDLMYAVIMSLFEQCRDKGLELSEGLKVSGLIENYDCTLREITDPRALRAHFGWAIWYHHTQRGEQLNRAFQIVWPDPKSRLFPWEDGCAEDVVNWQVGLYDKEPAQ